MSEKLTHIDKLRNPNYLGGFDLQDDNGKTINRIVTIKEVKSDMVFNQKSQSEESVITVYFQECKPIILNVTNRKVLKKVTGTNFIEQMVGKRIELTTKRVSAFGEFHDAVRIVNKVPGAVVVTVDPEKCIKLLETCQSLEDLAKVWGSLSAQEKAFPEVLAKKDGLKSSLK